MNTSTDTRSTTPGSTADARAEGRLRTVLVANAVTSSATGLVAAIAPDRIADILGVTATGWVRAVGLGLVLFAVDVVLVARSRGTALRRGALAVSVADAVWVVTTAAVLTFGWLSTSGVVVATIAALGVADLAVLQLWYRNRMLAGVGAPRPSLTP